MIDDKNRNLLFAVLAVQLKGVSPERAMEAAAAWLINPSTPLSIYLEQLDILPAADIKLLGTLVEEIVKSFEGDAEEALKSLPGGTELSLTLIGQALPASHETRPMVGDLAPGMHVIGAAPLEELPGRYSQLSEHGRGGMGRVLLVHDELFGREIALKELLLPHDTDYTGPAPSPMGQASSLLGRFLQEARITGQLEHPSIVPVYEIGRRLNGTFYYTMKLMRGKTLARAIRDCKNLEERLRILPSILDLCQALAYAHSRRVIHRDIKPANAMIGEFGETVLLDWGLAKIRGAKDVYSEKMKETLRSLKVTEPDKTPQTVAGEAIGTPHYMPPEQARGDIESLDERSDVYSMGAVLYETLTGNPPFEGATARAIILQVLNIEPKPIESVAPEAPPELSAICRKAMAKLPENRYQSMIEFRDELIRFQTGAFVQSYRYNLREALRLYYRRHRVGVHATLIALAVVLVVGLWSYISIWQARAREHDQRIAAETAHAQAEAARSEAETAREAEAKERQTANQNAYLARLQLTQQYLTGRNYSLARDSLWNSPESFRGPEWRMLLALAYPDRYLSTSLGNRVCAARFSPDGTTIATANDPEAPVLYQADSGEALRTMLEGNARLTIICWNPAAPQFLIADDLGSVRLWNSATGQLDAHIKAHTGIVLSAEYTASGTELLTEGQDGAARLWDASTGTLLHEFSTGKVNRGTASIRPDGHWIATTSAENEVTVYRREDWSARYTLPGTLPRFSPDGKSLVLLLPGGELGIYDAESGAERHRTSPGFQDFYEMNFNRDGTQLIVASADKRAVVLNLADGQILYTLEEQGFVYQSQFVGDEFILNFVEGNTLRLWSTATHLPVYSLPANGSYGTMMDVSPTGQVVTTGSHYSTFQVWDVLKPNGRQVYSLPRPNLIESSVSPSGNALILGNGADGVYLVQRSTPSKATRFDIYTSNQQSFGALSNAGNTLLMAQDNFTVILWDLTGEHARVKWTAACESGCILALALSPDEKFAAAACWDGTVRLWDAQTGNTIRTLAGHTGPVRALAFSADSTRVASASEDSTVRIWGLESGEPLAVLAGATGSLEALAFGPEDSTIAAAGWSGDVYTWDTTTFESRNTYRGSERMVTRLEYIDKDRLIAVAGRETLTWDLRSPEPLTRIQGIVQSFQGGEFAIRGLDESTITICSMPDSPAATSAASDIPPQARFEKARLEATPGEIHLPVEGDVHIALADTELRPRMLALASELHAKSSTALADTSAETRARLCLPANGQITAIGDTATPADLNAAVEHLLALPEPITLTLTDGGETRLYFYHPLPKTHRTLRPSMSKEDTIRLLGWLASLTEVQTISDATDSDAGLEAASMELEPSPEFPRESMMALGLSEEQQIIGIGGAPEDAHALHDAIQSTLKGLEADTPLALSISIRSGEFVDSILEPTIIATDGLR